MCGCPSLYDSLKVCKSFYSGQIRRSGKLTIAVPSLRRANPLSVVLSTDQLPLSCAGTGAVLLDRFCPGREVCFQNVFFTGVFKMHTEYSAQQADRSVPSSSSLYQHYCQELDSELSRYSLDALQQRQQELQHELDLMDEREKSQSLSAQAELNRETEKRQQAFYSTQGQLSQTYHNHQPLREQLSEPQFFARENQPQPRQDHIERQERYCQSPQEATVRQSPHVPEPAEKTPAEQSGTANGHPNIFDNQVLEELRRTGRAVVHTTAGTYVFSPSEDGQTIHCAVYPPGTFDSQEQREPPMLGAPTAAEPPVLDPLRAAPASRFYPQESPEAQFQKERPVVPSSIGMGEATKGYTSHPIGRDEEFAQRRWEQTQLHSNNANAGTSNQHFNQHVLIPNSQQVQDNAPKLVEFCIDALESVGRPLCEQGSYVSVAAYVHTVEENKPHLKTIPVPIDASGCVNFGGAPLQMIWRGEEFVHMKVYQERQYEAMGEAVGFIKLQFATLNAENAPMKVMLVGKENEPNGFLILRFSILGSLTSATSQSQGPVAVPALAVPQLGRSAGRSPAETYSLRDSLPYGTSTYTATHSLQSSAGPGNQLPTLPVGFLGHQTPEHQGDYLPQHRGSQFAAYASLTDARGRGYPQEAGCPDGRGIDRNAPIDGISNRDVEIQGQWEGADVQARASPQAHRGASLRMALPSPTSVSFPHGGRTEVDTSGKEKRVVPKKAAAKSAQNGSKPGVGRRSLLQRWGRGWCCEMSTGADLN
uniref:Uncharacterized protein n=1 Tax=Toxoplasma gondii COUG TaxID=1074873 RepID=A0A2G8XVD8_TOXGO|nr:hypothetical protein TGCOUG_297120 [Toxoplasma gondii COUG]